MRLQQFLGSRIDSRLQHRQSLHFLRDDRQLFRRDVCSRSKVLCLACQLPQLSSKHVMRLVQRSLLQCQRTQEDFHGCLYALVHLPCALLNLFKNIQNMSHLLQPTILLLRDGTDSMQGIGQIISNINAIQAVVDIVKSTLGPRGMDKMITTHKNTTISNDGATILKLLDIQHAAAKILVDIAKSQDNEVGDGTTTVTILAGELLKNAKGFIEDGMNPQIVIRGYKRALEYCLQRLNELVIAIDNTPEKRREMLLKCAETALNSKLLSSYKTFFAEIVVSAVEKLDTNLLDKELIGIKEVTGGSINDSFLVSGVAFKKTFSYAGFEQQPKKFTNPKIIILKIQLELKSEKENAEIRISNVEDFQSIVDAQWQIIYEKLQKIHDVGAQIVLSKLPIGDLATQWFADRGIFCAGRVTNEDINRVAKSTGAVLQTTVNNVAPNVLGTCGRFEERQIGAERYNLFEECPNSKSATIILRGGAEQFIKEAERSLNDAIMIVRRCFKTNTVVAGGGATEMELSKGLKNHSMTIQGKEQLVMNMFAKSLEVIPRIIADNAGLDSLDIINRLRTIHYNEKNPDENSIYIGVDISKDVGNNKDSFVWEPLLVKVNALKAATEAACTILSIDETVRNPKAEQQEQQRRIKKSLPTAGGRRR